MQAGRHSTSNAIQNWDQWESSNNDLGIIDDNEEVIMI